MPLGTFENEEAVVVYELAATVQVQERGHIFAGFIMDELFISHKFCQFAHMHVFLTPSE